MKRTPNSLMAAIDFLFQERTGYVVPAHVLRFYAGKGNLFQDDFLGYSGQEGLGLILAT